jgi:hypothetical protein
LSVLIVAILNDAMQGQASLLSRKPSVRYERVCGCVYAGAARDRQGRALPPNLGACD